MYIKFEFWGGGVGGWGPFQNFPRKITNIRYKGRGKNRILSVKTYVFIISFGLSVNSKLQSILEDNVRYTHFNSKYKWKLIQAKTNDR